jgi:hypothetical protein
MKKKTLKIPATDDLMAKVRASMAEAVKSAESRVKFNKPLLFRALSAHEITSVEVEFNGCGDSGQIEDTRFYRGKAKVSDNDKTGDSLVEGAVIRENSTWDADKNEWIHHAKTPTIKELIEHICYDLLEANHGGWEINEGSYGEFVFNVGDTEIELQFNERIESVNEHNETY